MSKISRLFIAVMVLVTAQLACNMPNGTVNSLPAPNQTLTALFSITPSTATPTLPPVFTATTQPGMPSPTMTQPAPISPTATHTVPAAPTATRTNLPIATVPSVRPRSSVKANFLSTPPTLDGDWSEWKDLTQEYPATSVVFGGANWVNEDDLAGSFHIGWDNNFLYIAVKARDDVYVQNATGDNIFKGDSIEILFDRLLKEDFYVTQLSPDDFQLGISPGRPNPDGSREAYLWFPANINGPRPGVTVAARQESGVYRVEAAIPWSLLETTPTAGMHYGFALSISDNDDAAQNAQQSMVSNVSERHLTDPTTWGDLELIK